MKKVVVLLLALVLCLSGCVVVEDDARVAELEAALAEKEAAYNELLAAYEAVVNGGLVVDTEDDDYHPEGEFVESEVLEQLKVTEYSYKNDWSRYHFIEIENGSEFDLEISVAVKFYNEAGELVGAKSDSENAFEHGHKMLFYFMPDEAYATTEYEITVTEEEYYDCVLSDLSYESIPAKEKEIVSVTNNGNEAAEFVECHILFFKDGKVVSFEWTYFTDDDSEIKPGKTITQEMDCYEPYDSYLIYFTGRKPA